jgi:hypothetical protein
VRFAAVGSEPAYFRALYLRAEPSPQLTALHQAARAAWALKSQPCKPYLSLLYANLAEERKPAIIGALGIRLPLTIRINAAELWADHQLGVPAGSALPGYHSPGTREAKTVRQIGAGPHRVKPGPGGRTR